MKPIRLAATIMMLFGLAVSPGAVWGTDTEDHDTAADHGDEHGKDSHLKHDRGHKNEVAVFLGATDEHGHDTAFTVGVDYKRRIADRWAVGILFDYAGNDLRNYVVAPCVSFWPGLGNLQLLAAAGIEYHDGRDDGDFLKADGGHHEDQDHSEFLVRLGMGYDVHLGEHWGIVPNINVDFVKDEEVWVYGLSFAYRY